MSSAKKLGPSERSFSVFEEQLMTREHYDFFSKLMYQISGVNLPYSEKNDSLVKNRMSKLLRKTKYANFDELMSRLKNPPPGLMNEFVSSLTTNKTHFFREDLHFKWFKDFLLTHFKNDSELRIWCAAASTGQEPYTIAMLLKESLTPSQLTMTKFLATDIDLEVLKKASQGTYRESEMDGCPPDYRKKFFTKVSSGNEDFYKAKDDLSKLIRFAPLNLVQERYPFQHKFHVIFCRNVLIYFDPPTTKKVVTSLVDSLSPGGFLVIGHSEAGSGKVTNVKQVTQAVFQKIGDREKP